MVWKKIDLYTAQSNPLWKTGSAKTFNTLKNLLILGNIIDIISWNATISKIQYYLSVKNNKLIESMPETSLPLFLLIIFTIFLIWFPKPKKHPKAAEILIVYIFIKKLVLYTSIFITLKEYITVLDILLTVVSGTMLSLIFAVILFCYSRFSEDYRLNHKLEVKV